MNHAELLSSLTEGQLQPQGLDEAVLAFEFDDDLVTVVPAQSSDGVEGLEVSVFVGQLPPLDDSAALNA